METLTTCPRGHALAENAVYCTVCWIRVEPEDPAIAAARQKRRRRVILGIPLLGAASVVVGIAVGSMLGGGAGGPGASVVALPPSAVASAADPVTSADEPVAVVAEPLAATVADPVQSPAASGCVVLVRDEEVACTSKGDGLQFTVCVPEATSLIRVGSRPDDSASFRDASSTISLGGASTCPAGEIAADIAIDSFSPVATWRIVGRDAADQKIWKSRIVAQSTSP